MAGDQTSEPLIVRAFTSDGFTRSARQVTHALDVDDSWVSRVSDPFVLVIDGEGLWLCPEEPELEPYISVGWPIVGKLRDGWGSRGNKVDMIGGVVLTIITAGQFGGAGQPNGPTLCVPISSTSGPVELVIPIDSIDGISSKAEKHRPRVGWGPMLPWVEELESQRRPERSAPSADPVSGD